MGFKETLELDKEILTIISQAGVNSVFKGGTSLLIKYDGDYTRISQDVDIAIDASNFEDNISKIVDELRAAGLVVEEDGEAHEDYAKSFLIKKGETNTILDISKYKLLDSRIGAFDSLEINGHQIKVFPDLLTLVEKLMALQVNIGDLDIKTINVLKPEQLRKIRHLHDSSFIYLKNKDHISKKELDSHYAFALKNEVTREKFNNISNFTQLLNFSEDKIQNLRNYWNAWDGGDFGGKEQKPDFEEFIKNLAELKRLLDE